MAHFSFAWQRLRGAISGTRALSVVGFGMAALCLGGRPAEAARECEDPSYEPDIGHCARLPTSELFYYDTGPSRRGNGQAVIFLHAGSGNADAFRHQLAAFHRAGYRAIAYDRKNVGRSSNTLRDDALVRSRGSTMQDLDDLANHLGISSFHLVGIAAGGQVVLDYVAWAPHRVKSIVLAATLGPAGLSNNEPSMAELRENISLPFEVFCRAEIPDPLQSPLRTRSANATSIPEVLPEHRELGTWFRATNRAGVEDFRHIEENARHRTYDGCRFTSIGANQPTAASPGFDPALHPGTFEKLHALITVRTLLLAGTGDVYFSPPVHMLRWGSHIEDAQYTQLDTGHAPQFENPKAFNAAVLRFLKGGYPFKKLRR